MPTCLKRKASASDEENVRSFLPTSASAGPASFLAAAAVMQAGVSHTSRLQQGAHSLARLGRGSPGSDINEDRFISAAFSIPAVSSPLHVFAVFDGHTSSSVSTMCMEQLPQLMTQLISSALGANSSSSSSDDVDVVMPGVLQAVFQQLDSMVQTLDNSGSTATVAVLTPQRLHIAWVGDSRAVVLAKGGSVQGFTQEHRATREDEQERVAAAGGTVLNNSGLRVMGILQCTRAIGDKDLQPYGVIPTPDMLSLPRTGQEEFLVLATDGLWDVLSNEEVYEYALKAGKRVEERQARQPSSSGTCSGCQAAGIAARALTSLARKQRSSRDDITVLLVNMAAPCSCVNPPAVLSSATTSSRLLASSSTGGACKGREEDSVASGVQLRSSPAALGQQQEASPEPQPQPAAAAQQQQQQPRQQQQEGVPKPPQQPQQSLPAVPRLPHPHLQQQQRKWHPGMSHHGLLLQPSVCPGSASAVHAAAAHDAGPHHHAGAGGGLQSALLSDLALSSPFAMMLGGALAEFEVEVDVIKVSDFPTSSGLGVVSGGSAPPALDLVAALAPTGSSGLRKRSLSVALGNSRSCGSAGAPPLGSIGSAEPPVVVLT